MNRKSFIKSIAGFIGIAAVTPAVLLSKPKSTANEWKSYAFKTNHKLNTDAENPNKWSSEDVLLFYQKTGMIVCDTGGRTPNELIKLMEWQNRGYK